MKSFPARLRRQSRWFKPSLEMMESRLAPAVTISDFTARWLPAFTDQLSSAFTTGAANDLLGGSLPGLGTSLASAYAASGLLDDQLQAVVDKAVAVINGDPDTTADDLDPSDPDDLRAYLQRLHATQTFNVSNIPSSAVDRLDVGLSIDTDNDELAEFTKELNVSLDFTNLALDLGDGVKVDLKNDLQLTTRAIIDEADFADNSAASLRFRTDLTTIKYQPRITTGKVTIANGTLAGVIDYAGDITASLGATFTFGVQDPPTPPGPEAGLPTLSANFQSEGTQDAVLSIELNATLDGSGSSPLPPFAYRQTFEFDITSGGDLTVGDPQLGVVIGGTFFDVTTPQGRVELLKKAAAPVFEKIDALIPTPVAEFLLGENQVTGAFGGIQLKELLLDNRPIDFLGLPEPVVEVLVSFLKAKLFAGQLDDANTGNVDDLQQEGTSLGLRFPILDEPAETLLAIFNGGRDQNGDPVVLATYRFDLVTEIAKFYGVDLDQVPQDQWPEPLKQILKTETDPLGNTVRVLDVGIQFDTEDFKEDLVRQVRNTVGNALGGDAGERAAAAADFILDHLGDGVEFSFDGRFFLTGGLSLGVDTQFIIEGVSVASLVDSFFAVPGSLFHFAFDMSLSASADISETVEEIDFVTETITNFVGAVLGEETKEVVNTVVNFLGSANLTLAASGQLHVGICDGDVHDGRLRASEIKRAIEDGGGIGDFLFAQGQLTISAKGRAKLLGIEGGFDTGEVELIPNFHAGCSLEDFAASVAGTGGSEAHGGIRDPFAEFNTDTGVLQVYGSSVRDVITIKETSDGLIEVSRNTLTPLTSDGFNDFTADDISEIVVDLRGGVLTRVREGTDPADGGGDSVEVDPSIRSGIEVTIHGGTGGDFVFAQDDQGNFYDGTLTVFAGEGTDVLSGGSGSSFFLGEGGDDTLFAGPGFSIFVGGDGNDKLQGFEDLSGSNSNAADGIWIGGPGTDVLRVGSALQGRFILIGGSYSQDGPPADDPGHNVLIGGAGDDILIGGNAFGDAFDPTPVLTAERIAIILGGPGDDEIYGQGGLLSLNNGALIGDILIGGWINSTEPAGFDTIRAGAGKDFLFGGNVVFDDNNAPIIDTATPGAADMDGGAGADVILGGPDGDIIQGGPDNDFIDPGLGTNQARGGSGDDAFITGRGIDSLFGDGDDDSFFIINPDSAIHSPGGAITIDGGGQPGDNLDAQNGGGFLFNTTYDPGTAGHDGSWRTTDGARNLTVNFVRLAQIFDTVSAGQFTVNMPDLENTIGLSNGGEHAATQTVKLQPDAFVPIDFGNKFHVDINGNAQVDVFNMNLSVGADALTTLDLFGNEEGDGFNIAATPGGVLTIARGNNGDDVFNVGNAANSLDDIQGPLFIEGNAPSASDAVFVNDQGDTDSNVYDITNQTVDRNGMATITYATVESLDVNAGTGDDVINVHSTNVNTPTRIDAGPGSDRANVGSGAADDDGNLDDIQGRLFIHSGASGDGRDEIYINDRAKIGRVNYTISPTQVVNFDLPDTFKPPQCLLDDGVVFDPARPLFAGIDYDGSTEFLRLDGTDDVNIFDVKPSLATEYHIDGNLPPPGDCVDGGGDYLMLDTTGTTGRKLHITGLGQGFWSFTSPHQRVNFESIERFNHVDIVAIANGGRLPIVRVFDAETFELKFQVLAYEARFRGGVRVATGDVNCDGLPDLITAPGFGRRSTVKIFDGRPDAAGNVAGQLVSAFNVFARGFRGGVNLALGDTNCDGANDLIVSADRGWLPLVKVYDGKSVTTTHGLLGAFLAYPNHSRGGVRVAAGDIDNDGHAEIITGSGLGRSATVTIFDGDGFGRRRSFFPFARNFRNGVFVAAGDVNGDGIRDVIVGADGGWLPRVKVLSGAGLVGPGAPVELQSFHPFPNSTRTGVRVAVKPTDGGNPGFVEQVDVFMSSGSGGGGVSRRLRQGRFQGAGITPTVVDRIFGAARFDGIFLG